MKNFITLSVIFVAQVFTVFGQDDIYIPDNRFYLALLGQGLQEGQGIQTISDESARGLEVLDVSQSIPKIKDMTGIRSFVNLRELNCSRNQLSGELNLTGLHQLQKLNCERNNNIKYITGISCLNLTELKCGYNNLQLLEVGKMTQLSKLWCESNRIDYLDVKHLNKLVQLVCSGNQISTLDVLGLTKLKTLICHNNFDLMTLHVSNLSELLNLNCSNTSISELNTSNLSKMETLRCSGSEGRILHVANVDIQNMPDLETFQVSYSDITDVELQPDFHTKLVRVDIDHLSLGNSANLGLGEINTCAENLKRLDLKGLSQLNRLDVASSGLQHVDVRGTGLDPNGVALPYLDASNNNDIVICLDDPIGAIADTRFIADNDDAWCDCEVVDPCEVLVFDNTSLTDAGVEVPYGGLKDRLLTFLDENTDGEITQCELDAYTNTLLDLRPTAFNPRFDNSLVGTKGIEHFKDIESLYLGDDAIEEIDLRGNKELKTIWWIGVHKLTTINLTGLTNLKTLTISSPNGGVLKEESVDGTSGIIGLSSLAALTSISAFGNDIENLDLRANTLLTTVSLAENSLKDLNVTGLPLRVLNVIDNEFADGGIQGLTSLGQVSHFLASKNQFVAMDISTIRPIYVDLSHNDLMSVQLGDHSAVVELNLSNNPALDFNLTNQSNLREALIQNCPALTRIDLRGYDPAKLNTLSVVGTANTEVCIEAVDFLSPPSGFNKDLDDSWSLCDPCPILTFDNTSLNASGQVVEGGGLYDRLLPIVDSDGDGVITQCEADDIQTLDLNYVYGGVSPKIVGMIGIDQFSNLRGLQVRDNAIEDFGGLVMDKLTFLNISGNNLNELDCRTLVNLSSLHCNWNGLTELNITGLSLGVLTCGWNQLDNSNLIGLTEQSWLRELDLTSNDFVTLDVSFSPVMNTLKANFNDLISIDYGSVETFVIIQLGGNNFSSMDVSGMINLEHLSLGNQKSANGSSLLDRVDVTGCESMKYFILSQNDILTQENEAGEEASGVLGLSNLQNLEVFNVSECPLFTEVDLSGKTKLNQLFLRKSGVSTLKIGGTALFTYQYAYLDMPFCPNISEICVSSQIEIDIAPQQNFVTDAGTEFVICAGQQ